jgi:hypothetical protein
MAFTMRLNTDNALPRFDGDVTRYTVPPRRPNFMPIRAVPVPGAVRQFSGRLERIRTGNDILIYVNGMQNPKDAHRIAALALAGITRHDVFGVFNMPGTYANVWEGLTPACLWDELIDYLEYTPLGPLDWTKPLVVPTLRACQKDGTFGTDRIQCIADWLYPFITSPAVQFASALANTTDTVIDAGTSFINGITSTLGAGQLLQPNNSNNAARLKEAIDALKDTFINFALAFNAGTMNFSTGGLFNFLRSTHTAGKTVRILCHSQGTIVSSNAVDAWSWSKSAIMPPTQPPLPTTMYVMAGATPFWPPGVNLKFFTNSEDLVPWFSLGSSYNADALRFFNAGKRFNSVQHNTAPSGMIFNWFASHNIDEYFTSAFANAVRADLGLPPLTQDELTVIEADIQNQLDAFGIAA